MIADRYGSAVPQYEVADLQSSLSRSTRFAEAEAGNPVRQIRFPSQSTVYASYAFNEFYLVYAVLLWLTLVVFVGGTAGHDADVLKRRLTRAIPTLTATTASKNTAADTVASVTIAGRS